MAHGYILLAAAAVAKKIAVYTAGRAYGFPRVYKRAIEAARSVGGKGSVVEEGVKIIVPAMMRMPRIFTQTASKNKK
eukprot:CAMPEP_0113880494 /NCGR_PEP_ID=MMETSP0780_2-20120614/7818_1 /TAXON_ID=652834 /ORGANISM="Palpitomonas bilix" /LENGTH=76 /DNA_ID=CAMNT_0000867179 /DNA_START=327 /DNA_END=557 /DNA_ORIENTATION=- /assembly_acc=CAM_ASM_000599